MGRTLRGWLAMTVAFGVVLEVMLVGAIVWWPNFRENMGSVRLLAKPLPMLADMVDQIESLGVDAYVVGQHFFKGCNTLGAAAAVLFAAGAVAGEAHRGTLEIWLARPVTRLRLALERWLAGQAALWVPIVLTTATTPLLLRHVDESMELGPLLLCAVQQCLFLGAWYSVTFALSCAGSQPARIALGMLFFSIFEFAIYLVKTLTDWSLFRMTDIQTLAKVLRNGHLDPAMWVPLAAVNLVAFVVGYRLLARRTP
ncbi:MAG: ABC transporter permease subunit [Planctomycetes bacterium]|nr:ABC transporter permease subunit [Planctomycetota bacterium]